MILIVNHKVQNCGVYQFGKRFAKLAARSQLNVTYYEVENAKSYEREIKRLKPSIIIHNWYPITMGWLSDNLLLDDIKNYFIFHDGHIWSGKYYKYIFNGAIGPLEGATGRIPENKRIILPRPLFNRNLEPQENKMINIGSFGFGFWHKGFHLLVEKVNQEFDEAIINLHIPNAHFGDADSETALKVIEECKRLNIKSKIRLNITTDLLSENQLLSFLNANDINIFMYQGFNEGLSSVIDYALSVKRPLAITENMMFRHILSDEISIEKHSIKEIIENGTDYTDSIYSKWSPEKFVEEFDKEFENEGN